MPLVTAHPDFSYFFRILDPTQTPNFYTKWEGNVVRQAAPKWMSTPYRMTGAGAVLIGARWSVRGLMPTVYASTDPATLSAEALYKALRRGWQESDFHPLLTVGMYWKLELLLDLREPFTLRALRLTYEDIAGVDWENEQANGREPVTQAIARAVFERQAEGLIVPSARRKEGINIVYFPTHRRKDSIIHVLKPESLPPDMHGLDSD
jgi:RES domain-containing protein